MKIGKSTELEIGKCGEYFAIFKITKEGFVCFCSDQGLPYDIIVEVDGVLLKGQVRSTLKMRDYGKSKSVYRFSTRTGKRGVRSTLQGISDFYAFVAIEDEKVAFMTSNELISSQQTGSLIQTVEFRTNTRTYPGRSYANGTQRMLNYCRNIESYSDFSRIVTLIGGFRGR